MERTLGTGAGGGSDGEGGGVGGGAEGGDTAGGVAKAPVAVLETPFAWQRRGRKDDEEGVRGLHEPSIGGSWSHLRLPLLWVGYDARRAYADPFRCQGYWFPRGAPTPTNAKAIHSPVTS